MPSTNLPKKSHERKQPIQRHITVVKDIDSKIVRTNVYKNIDEFCKRIQKLKLNKWVIKNNQELNQVNFKFLDEHYLLSKYEIIVDEALEFSCLCYGWSLPNDHSIYQNYRRSLRLHTISTLIKDIESLDICDGLGEISTEGVHHVIPLNSETTSILDGTPVLVKTIKRSKDCSVLIAEQEKKLCCNCKSFSEGEERKKVANVKLLKSPLNSKAPLSVVNRSRIELALKDERKHSKKLEKQVSKMKQQILDIGIEVSQDLSNDFETILGNNKENITPFMKMFWEQQKILTNTGLKRYHPMIIRFCLSLVAKSPAAYEEMRSSGLLLFFISKLLNLIIYLYPI